MKEKGPISWLNTITLTATPLIAIVGGAIYWSYYGFRFEDIALMGVLYGTIGLCITAGYHRYFSHKTYNCHWSVELFYLLFGAAAFQNSALEWSAQHRIHHREVDTDRDPYNVKRGFFWAHMGWVFYKNHPDPTFSTVPDLKKNKLVMWQHRNFFKIGLSVGILLPTLIGYLYGNALGGFLIGGVMRLVLLHHTTFLINSAAHIFGTQPYSDNSSARDSWWLALFTFGEGYHNFHHTFQGDYRNGVRYYHWDPAKWLIATFAGLGLASNLRRTPILSITRARLQLAQKNTESLIKTMPLQVAESMRKRREQLQAQIEVAAFEFTRVHKRYRGLLDTKKAQKNSEHKKLIQELKQQLNEYRERMHTAWQDYKQWLVMIENAASI